MTAHTPPLTVVTAALGCDENSFSVLRHAKDVNALNAFHAVRDNTSHSRRVTRAGSFFIGWGYSSKREQATGWLDALFEVLQISKAESIPVQWKISIV